LYALEAAYGVSHLQAIETLTVHLVGTVVSVCHRSLCLCTHVTSPKLPFALFLVSLCCVGATQASEFSHSMLFEELQHVLTTITRLDLVFVGPHIGISGGNPSGSLSFTELGTCEACAAAGVTRRMSYKIGSYHDVLPRDAARADIVVALNAGFTDGVYGPEWRPTIEFVLASDTPLLVTSYADEEAPKDFEFVQATARDIHRGLDVCIPPSPNPYGSVVLRDDYGRDSFFADNSWCFVVKGRRL
jgi:hypothetical protein